MGEESANSNWESEVRSLNARAVAGEEVPSEVFIVKIPINDKNSFRFRFLVCPTVSVWKIHLG